MAAFATIGDLETRWRSLSSLEHVRVTAMLDDASALIRAYQPNIDDLIDAATLDAAIPRMVCVAMIKRAMTADDTPGVSSQMQVAGPFSQQTTYSNPSGDLYLTRAEKRLISGRRRQFAGMVDMSQPVVT